jgi:DNA-binding helix-hairpin-helix protein with protein kinase domain
VGEAVTTVVRASSKLVHGSLGVDNLQPEEPQLARRHREAVESELERMGLPRRQRRLQRAPLEGPALPGRQQAAQAAVLVQQKVGEAEELQQMREGEQALAIAQE